MRNNLLIGLFLLMSSLSIGQDSTSFTLEQAKNYALEHNYEILNAAHSVAIAHEQVKETIGMGLPQVNINGTFNNSINLPVQVVDASFINPNAPPGSTISFKAGTEYSSTGGLQVGQLLFNGSYLIGVKAVKYVEEFQANLAVMKQEDVMYNVIQAYELASIAKENLVFADSIVSLTSRLVNKQKNYYDLGLMKQDDMDQLQFTLLSVRNAKMEAEVQYNNTLILLKLTMGYPVDQKIELAQNVDKLINFSDVKYSGDDLYSNQQYQLLEKQVFLTELNVRNKQFASWPTLNAFFQHSYSAYRNEFNFFANQPWYVQTVWGLQLSVPIYSGGQRRSQTAQTKIKLLQDENNLLLMEQSLKYSSIQTSNNYKAALSKYELQKENIRLARSIYESEAIKEKIGQGNSILVTQKQQQLMMAQAQYVGSLVGLFQAKRDLNKLHNKIISPEQ